MDGVMMVYDGHVEGDGNYGLLRGVMVIREKKEDLYYCNFVSLSCIVVL